MQIRLNGTSGEGWEQTVDVSNGVPNGLDMNALMPSTFFDGSTPKAQPNEQSNWSQYDSSAGSLHAGEWGMHTGMTPTGEAPWPAQPYAPQADSGQRTNSFASSPQNQRTSAPMPIPERSQTEPLWQRRLNAKNQELQHLHSRLSAPDVTADVRVTPSEDEGKKPTTDAQNVNPAWQQGTALDVVDHDFTHASPNTLRLLGIDPSTFAQSVGTGSYSNSAASSNSPQMSNDAVSITGMPTYAGMGNANGNDFAAQMALMQTLNAGTMPMDATGAHSTSLPQTGSMMNMELDRQSARAFRHSMQEGEMTHLGGDDTSSTAYTGNGYRTSSDYAMSRTDPYVSAFASSANFAGMHTGSTPIYNNSAAAMGKGVINKVIVPPGDGVASDAIDLQTGEAGQMRHVCPHLGCDKHFSTSGHARRHSRIHDCLRPFECPHDGCHATFTRRDNCTQHQRARHRYQLVAHRIGDE